MYLPFRYYVFVLTYHKYYSLFIATFNQLKCIRITIIDYLMSLYIILVVLSVLISVQSQKHDVIPCTSDGCASKQQLHN